MRLAMVSTLVGLAAFALGAVAAPRPDVERILDREITGTGILYRDGKLVVGPAFANDYSYEGSALAWRKDRSYMVSQEESKNERDRVARVSQIGSREGEFFAKSTSVYSDRGLRSHTECIGGLKDGKPSNVKCATMTRRMCMAVDEVLRSPKRTADSKDGQTLELTAKEISKIKELTLDKSLDAVTKTCGEHFKVLAKISMLAQKRQAFGDEYDGVVKEDQASIFTLMKKNYDAGILGIVGIGFGITGSTQSGSSDRNGSVLAAADDVRLLSLMISECTNPNKNFVYAPSLSGGSGGSSGGPRSGEPAR